MTWRESRSVWGAELKPCGGVGGASLGVVGPCVLACLVVGTVSYRLSGDSLLAPHLWGTGHGLCAGVYWCGSALVNSRASCGVRLPTTQLRIVREANG